MVLTITDTAKNLKVRLTGFILLKLAQIIKIPRNLITLILTYDLFFVREIYYLY